MPSDGTGSRFFDTIDDRARGIEGLIADASVEELVWISENRDFAETQRFVEKDEVDSGLVESRTTREESELIRDLFKPSVDYATAVERYTARLDEVMYSVYYLLLAGAEGAPRWTLSDLHLFWSDLAHVSGLDNAHAMHLSSGNWGFNVLDRAIEQFGTWTEDDATLNALLTGGVLDARTYVPVHQFGPDRAPARPEFAAGCRQRGSSLQPLGVVSLMCYAARQTSDTVVRRLAQREDAIAADFEQAGERLRAVAGSMGDDYHQLVARLHELRRRYDIFEYFGLYAFLRHMVLYRIRPLLTASMPEAAAAEFLRYATLYQYELALRVLTRERHA